MLSMHEGILGGNALSNETDSKRFFIWVFILRMGHFEVHQKRTKRYNINDFRDGKWIGERCLLHRKKSQKSLDAFFSIFLTTFLQKPRKTNTASILHGVSFFSADRLTKGLSLDTVFSSKISKTK